MTTNHKSVASRFNWNDSVSQSMVFSSNSGSPYSPRGNFNLISSVKNPLNTSVEQQPPSCATCKNTLKQGDDSQKKTGRFWKNCKACRNKIATTKRKSREQKNHQIFEASSNSKRRKISKTDANTDLSQPSLELHDRECSVCAETYSARNFPSLSTCTHEPEVCQDCFVEWLRGQMESMSWDSIGCPSSECNNQVTHQDVIKYAPEDMFTRSVFPKVHASL